MRHSIADFDAGPKSASEKFEVALAVATDRGRTHGRLVSYVAGSTPGQAQPTHSRTARLLRWLVACGRLVQLLLQLQQLAELLNIDGVGCWNAPRTWLLRTLIGLGGLLEDHVDGSIRRNRHHDVLGDR